MKPRYFAIVYVGPEIDNLGCWNYSGIAEINHPLLSPQGPKTFFKQLMQKCYLISKSLGHSVFALKDGTTCLSSPDAEHVYQLNGISFECHSLYLVNFLAHGLTKIYNLYKICLKWRNVIHV